MNCAEIPDPLGAVPRLMALREAIEQRALDCGRRPESIELVAVSKTYSADEVWPTLAIAGQRVFGENRVQEAQAKWSVLRERAATVGRAVVTTRRARRSADARSWPPCRRPRR